MKPGMDKDEAYLFIQLIREFMTPVIDMWKSKEELTETEKEDASYSQSQFRGELKKYLKEKPFFRYIHEWIKDLYDRDSRIDWSKDRQEFLELAAAYASYVDQYRQMKLGKLKDDYNRIA